jgi:DNA-directed RNA polymerase sigma subunit (sigma70/sigma32)
MTKTKQKLIERYLLARYKASIASEAKRYLNREFEKAEKVHKVERQKKVTAIKNLVKDSDLSKREKDIVMMRAEGKMTLEEIGKEYGVTRERIRELGANALKKIGIPITDVWGRI